MLIISRIRGLLRLEVRFDGDVQRKQLELPSFSSVFVELLLPYISFSILFSWTGQWSIQGEDSGTSLMAGRQQAESVVRPSHHTTTPSTTQLQIGTRADVETAAQMNAKQKQIAGLRSEALLV
ncbi:hypothetical protein J6590_064882 [Homalodisca vitripennis]|nr:hypothetical protein J6590_064882 [Homalodisca vitripennis]